MGDRSVIQFHSFFDFFPDRGVALFYCAKEGKISLAFAGQLLFLYVLECEICHPDIIVYSYNVADGRICTLLSKESRRESGAECLYCLSIGTSVFL